VRFFHADIFLLHLISGRVEKTFQLSQQLGQGSKWMQIEERNLVHVLQEMIRATRTIVTLIDWFSQYFGVFPVWQRHWCLQCHHNWDSVVGVVLPMQFVLQVLSDAPLRTFIAICWSVKCIKSRKEIINPSETSLPPYPILYIQRSPLEKLLSRNPQMKEMLKSWRSTRYYY